MKEEGGVDLFDNISVKYIAGHNPDLVIDGKKRIDLKSYSTRDKIENLLKSEGFVKKDFSCINSNTDCIHWARLGECEKNPKFMHQNCAFSCGKCSEKKLEL